MEIAASNAGRGLVSSPWTPSVELDGRDRLLAAARAVGDRLLHLALRTGDGVGWLGLRVSNGGYWPVVPLGLDLYDGLPRIALSWLSGRADRG